MGDGGCHESVGIAGAANTLLNDEHHGLKKRGIIHVEVCKYPTKIDLVLWKEYSDESFTFKFNVWSFKLKIHSIRVDLYC